MASGDPLDAKEIPTFNPTCRSKENDDRADAIISELLNISPSPHTETKIDAIGQSLAKAIFYRCNDSYVEFLKNINTIISVKEPFLVNNGFNEDEWYLKALHVVCLRFIAPEISSEVFPELESLVQNVMKLYTLDMPCSASVVKAMLFVLKSFAIHMEISLLIAILRNTSILLTSHTASVVKAARDVTQCVLSSLDNDTRQIILDDLVNAQPWSKTSYIIATDALRVIPDEYISNEDLTKLMNAVYRGLQTSHLMNAAGNLFKAFAFRINFNFIGQIVPYIKQWIDENDDKLFLNNTNKAIVNKCVRKYKTFFYLTCKELNMPNQVCATALHMCISNGYTTAEAHAKDIQFYLESKNMEVRHLAFMSLCVHLKSSERITFWKLQLIKHSLNIKIVDMSLSQHKKAFKNFVLKVQYCVSSILTAPEHKDHKDALPYIKFFKHILYVCYQNIGIYTAESLKFAYYLFDVFGVTFTEDAKIGKDYICQELAIHLKTCYNQFCAVALKLLIKKIEQNELYSEETFDIILHYLLDYVDTPDNLLSLISHFMEVPNFPASQKAKNYTLVLLKRSNSDLFLASSLFSNMKSNVETQLSLCTSTIRPFETSAIFSVFGVWHMILKNCEYSQLPEPMIHFMFEACEMGINYVFMDLEANVPTENGKRLMEHTLINAVEVMSTTLLAKKYTSEMLESFLKLSERIITYSNLKRPVSTTTICYQNVMEEMAEDPASFELFVKEKLNSILTVEIPSQRIRRYPEVSMIVKAIASADKSDEKRYVHQCIQFLNNFITNETVKTRPTVAAAVFSLDSILLDSNFTLSTVRYEDELLILGFKLFGLPSYVIKNAAIQLIETLSNRLLGQTEDLIGATITQNFFMTHLRITNYILDKLQSANATNNEIVLGILMFLAQIASVPNCLGSHFDLDLQNEISNGLVALVKSDNYVVMKFAANAYLSLVDLLEIPNAVPYFIEYIKTDFKKFNANQLHTLFDLVTKLKERYSLAVKNEQNVAKLELACSELMKYLTQNVEKNVMLDIQIEPVRNVFSGSRKQLLKDFHDCVERIAIYKKIEYLTQNLDGSKFRNLLDTVVSYQNMTYQELFLNSVIDKVKKTVVKDETSTELTNALYVLATFMLANDTHNYLFDNIAYSIIILTNSVPETYVTPFDLYVLMHLKIKSNWNRVPYHTVMAILYKVQKLSKRDIKIASMMLKEAVKDMYVEDVDKHIMLSEALIYFNKCVPVRDRPMILEIALTLLLEEEEEHFSLYFYLNQALSIDCDDSLSAIGQIINLPTLHTYFKDIDVAKKFLKNYVAKLSAYKLESAAPLKSFYSHEQRNNKKIFALNAIFKQFSDLDDFPYDDYIAAVLPEITK